MTDRERQAAERFAAALSRLSESEIRDLFQSMGDEGFLSDLRIQTADGAQQRAQA